MKLTAEQRKFIDENKMEKSPNTIAKKLELDPDIVMQYITGQISESQIEQPPKPKRKGVDDVLMGKRKGAVVMTPAMSGHIDDTRVKGNKTKSLGHIHRPRG